MAQATTIKEFESVFPKLEEVLLDHAKSYKLPTQALDWYKAVSVEHCYVMMFGGVNAQLRTNRFAVPSNQCHRRQVQPRHVGA
jgi:farnesyl diphosphate synthase